MAYRKSTLRRMSPTTRSVARLIGEGESVIRRLKNLLPVIKAMEARDIERQSETAAVLDRVAGR